MANSTPEDTASVAYEKLMPTLTQLCLPHPQAYTRIFILELRVTWRSHTLPRSKYEVDATGDRVAASCFSLRVRETAASALAKRERSYRFHYYLIRAGSKSKGS